MKLALQIRTLLSILRFIYTHPFSLNRRTSTFFRFARWQLGTRLLNYKVVVPWVDDARIVSGVGEFGLTGNIYCGFMEYEDMAFLLHLLRPHHTFVDVGANVGAYTILASKVIGSHSIAFEPLPQSAQRLADQIFLNQITNLVTLRNIGIGDAAEELYFTNNLDTVNKVVAKGVTEHATKIKVDTLDNELTPDCSYFLKIDVEGFEGKAIRGAKNILNSGSVVAMIVELNGRGVEFGDSNEDVHKLIVSHGFIPVQYQPKTRTLLRLAEYNQVSGNTLYVRNFEDAVALLRAAPLRMVHTAGGICI